MSLTNTAEDMLVTWMFTDGTLPTRPTAWYAALHTSDPGDTPASTEVTTGIDADYVRKSITFADPVTNSGQVLSEAATTWTVESGSSGYTVTHVSIWSASTAGTCYISGALPVARTLAASQVLTFSIGDIIAAIN